MITQELLIKTINEILEGSDQFLVEVIIHTGNRITVFFDSDHSVSIADCKHLSRSIESRLDRDNEDYELTVSSSGMDRPIKLLRQYKKRIGNELQVVLISGEKINGVLVNAEKDSIELEHPVKNPKKEIGKPNTLVKTDTIKTAKIIINIGKQE